MTESIRYGSNAPRIAGWAEERLKKYMRAAGVSSVVITSSRRAPADQARIMYNNCISHGLSSQRRLYGAAGNRVLDMFNPDAPKDLVINLMAGAVITNGPTNVSRHCTAPGGSEVFDVGPSSVNDGKYEVFLQGLKQGQDLGEIDELIWPPDDPAIHIEFLPNVPDHPIRIVPLGPPGGVIVPLLVLLIGLAFFRKG